MLGYLVRPTMTTAGIHVARRNSLCDAIYRYKQPGDFPADPEKMEWMVRTGESAKVM